MIQTDAAMTNVMNDEVCWQAMLDRDSRYDGLFVCVVRSTGIYCRPSCPARKPHRKNVAFYPDPEAAEAAGYRPCKRCRPQAVSLEAEVVQQVCRYIDEHLHETITLTALGEHVHYSPYHLQRLFKRVLGLSPREYADAARLERFRAELKVSDSVTDAMYNAGYNSSSQLYAGGAAASLGMEPSVYRRGGRGMKVGYTIVDSALGRLLIAATENGIAGVSLGDSDAALEAFLQTEFPEAELTRDDAGFREWVDGVLAQVSGELPPNELPVDMRATAFQRKVWNYLRSIPLGETRTYGEIARDLGQPNAARAVARACATNRIAVVIPCHRVIGEDGSLRGYRWGIERKQALLASEKQHSGA